MTCPMASGLGAVQRYTVEWMVATEEGKGGRVATMGDAGSMKGGVVGHLSRAEALACFLTLLEADGRREKGSRQQRQEEQVLRSPCVVRSMDMQECHVTRVGELS